MFLPSKLVKTGIFDVLMAREGIPPNEDVNEFTKIAQILDMRIEEVHSVTSFSDLHQLEKSEGPLNGSTNIIKIFFRTFKIFYRTKSL